MRREDPLEAISRSLCLKAGLDPDSRIAKVGSERGMPAWCAYRDEARQIKISADLKAREAELATIKRQKPEYEGSPLTIIGDHQAHTIRQMQNCMKVGNVVGGAICADGHYGYAQPVGGVVAYDGQISISGVGFDIGCGNMAVRLDARFSDIQPNVENLIHAIKGLISFGIERRKTETVEHEIFDDRDAWMKADVETYRSKAVGQLGTVGGGNHYVDLFYDREGFVWIGVHFGSRGLGHSSAHRYLVEAGGKDGKEVDPTLVDLNSELGQRYLAAMELSGRYSYAGREWVVEQIRALIGANITKSVHNHHNFGFKETHKINGVDRELYVVRKGATPCFPGQLSFVGGSMADDAVILEGVDSEQARSTFYSTVHGAGRVHSRSDCKRLFTRDQMHEWIKQAGVYLIGADLDESPMAYRRLPDVLAYHQDSIKVQHYLRPFAVIMAGEGEHDPFKD